MGSTPSQAFFVRCDTTTTSPADIAAHQVRVLYGLAPLRPSEFLFSQLILSTTDPARPLTEATTSALQPRASEIRVFFPTFPGFTHTIEQADSPGVPLWPALTTFQGDGSWQSHTLPCNAAAQFLRIRTQ